MRMSGATPLAQDLVLLGGGHAHALLLTRWAMRPLPGARITLVSPDPTTPYTGMLPGVVAGHYAPETHEIDLVRLARRAGARLLLDRAEGLDLAAKTVTLAERGALAYDALSLDIGSESGPIGASYQGATPVKPFGRFLPALAAFLAALERGAARPRAAVIGAGIGGVEIAFALAHRLRGRSGAEVALLSRGVGAPSGVSARLWRRVSGAARSAGLRIEEGFDVASVEDGAAHAVDGRTVGADFIVASAGAQAPAWLRATELPLDPAGFIRVAPTLAVEGRSDVFAAGDVAAMSAAPRPKAGVYAVRQAPLLARNLRAALIAGADGPAPRLRAYHPQRDYLKLVSLGGRRAIAEKAGLMIEGARIWRLKDRIDRRFMERFAPQPPRLDPPPRETAADAAAPRDPLCAGCGAKIGAEALEAALSAARLGRRRETTRRGPGGDAAFLARGDGELTAASVDHLRAFTEDLEIFGEVAALHGLSDLWASGAAPEAALVAITLPPATPKMQTRMTAEMLRGVERALAGAGADLVGGHTAEGLEAALGVTALGATTEASARRLSRAAPGDALLLTKPIGLGVLLAAEMRQEAPGPAIAGALEAMRRSNGPAAAILGAADVHAMTDVTGFGLLGHLARMLPEALGAELDLDAVPILPAAEALAAAGTRSSLYSANAARLAELGGAQDAPALRDLLVDPQTSGGLLAALAPERAEAALAELRRVAPGAAIIGRVARRGAGARFHARRG